MVIRDGASNMYHVYSDWKRVYCIFPKQLKNSVETQRGWLYKQTLEVNDCGQHLKFVDYITEKDYFKIKLTGKHEAREFA